MNVTSTKTITAGRKMAILGITTLFVLSAFLLIPNESSDASVTNEAYYYIESSEDYSQGITKYLDYDGEHSIEVRLDLDGVTTGDSSPTLNRTIEYRMLDTMFVGCDFASGYFSEVAGAFANILRYEVGREHIVQAIKRAADGGVGEP